MKLGYLGPKGSYSYEAAKAYGLEAELIALNSFYEIIKKVELDEIDEGILPIENSTEGAVTSVMDGILKTEHAKIIAELILPIRHNLLGYVKDIKDISYIYSHSQALEQCREYIQKNLPHASVISCESTSLACSLVKEKRDGFAAIANLSSAAIYGLNVLNEGIQDNLLNQTRFVVIGKSEKRLAPPYKTSIAFSCLDDRPGALYNVLKEFAERDINLTRIESRPAKTELGKYIFYVDLIGSVEDESVKEALIIIKNISSCLKIFGCYSVLKE